MMEQQQEMIGNYALRTMKERGRLAKLARARERSQYSQATSTIVESAAAPATNPTRLPRSSEERFGGQAEWAWTDESRNFQVFPQCVCKFPAVLTKRVKDGKATYKITCTRIRCAYEVGPDPDKNKLLKAWKMLQTLNRL